jgi:DNA processing protein
VIRHIHADTAEYPSGLGDLEVTARPPSFSVEGDFVQASPRVAIVGSRAALDPVVAMVKRLAAAVATAGGVVVSGGAMGVDTAAHEGALEARGRTWAVLGCGAPLVTPSHNKDLFARITQNGGAIVRPFPDGTGVHTSRFLSRNGVLVALSEIVLVAQAGLPSGTVNTARWAHKLRRPLWVAPGPPWEGTRFAGSWHIVDRYSTARLLRSEKDFVEKVLGVRDVSVPPPNLDADELVVFEALGSDEKHPDELAAKTGLPAAAVSTALLTLALGDVVVEGSAGLFRRKTFVTG